MHITTLFFNTYYKEWPTPPEILFAASWDPSSGQFVLCANPLVFCYSSHGGNTLNWRFVCPHNEIMPWKHIDSHKLTQTNPPPPPFLWRIRNPSLFWSTNVCYMRQVCRSPCLPSLLWWAPYCPRSIVGRAEWTLLKRTNHGSLVPKSCLLFCRLCLQFAGCSLQV